MKMIIAPDSFKGTLTAPEVCEIISRNIKNGHPDAEIISVPLADGGEGTLECFSLARPGEFFHAKTVNAGFQSIAAPYLMYGPTAFIEMAKCAGFAAPHKALHDSQRPSNPMLTTTYGVGLLIRDAIHRGARKIIVGLGGSSTNDGGCGMAAALGTKFYRTDGSSFVPTGGTLSEIVHVDNTETISLLRGESDPSHERIVSAGRGPSSDCSVNIIGMCDVSNPLCGPQGAAYVFAPQKGATPEEVAQLDCGLQNLVSAIDDSSAVGTFLSGDYLPASGAFRPGVHRPDRAPVTHLPVSGAFRPGAPHSNAGTSRSGAASRLARLPGSGAACGMGFGIRSFLGGRLKSGIGLMLDTIDFDSLLWNADYVITGEGCFDSQSLNGKVVSGICSHAKAADVPVIVVCGTALQTSCLDDYGIAEVIESGSLDLQNLTKQEAHHQAVQNLNQCAERISRCLR